MIPADAARETTDVQRLRELAPYTADVLRRAVVDHGEDDAELAPWLNVQFLRQASDVILALCATLEERERDTARLDAIERFAITFHGPEANMEDVVQLTGPCHEDEDFCDDDCDDESRQYQWEVTGPPCSDGFGNFIGQGPTLRAAVDRALLEESITATPETTHD